MDDASTLVVDGDTKPPERLDTHRRIRPQRGLPGGRAVVGALLVAAAAVAVFASHLHATSAPATRYLVASQTIAPGTMIQDRSTALELFSAAPIDLLPPVDQRVLMVDELESLVGQVVLVALERGELLQRSAILEADGLGDAHVLSFSLPRADAVAGDLVPGERIDVLATYTLHGETFTAFIVRGVPLVAIEDGAGGGGGSVVLTVAVSNLADVQALGHAVNAASVFVTRSTASERDPARAPGAFVPSADAPGPLPDPTAIRGSGGPEVVDDVEPDGSGTSPEVLEPTDTSETSVPEDDG